jgi:hypothetical protein
MKSSFTYVDEAVDHLVTLCLFVDPAGEARAKVIGPSNFVWSHGEASPNTATPLPLSKAFALAIRIANRNDVEIVVSGDSSLWQADWGELIQANARLPQAVNGQRTGQILAMGRN